MQASAPPDPRIESLLRRLDPQQRACVLEPAGPLVIEAGPGSGKTRVLATRAAYRVAAGTAEASRTLVVTFTRRAAGELKLRLRRAEVHGVRVGTIHAVAYELVERYRADRGLPALRVAAAPRRLLAQATEAWPELDHDQLARRLDWAAARALTPEQLGEAWAVDRRGQPSPDRRSDLYPDLDPHLVAEAYRRYQALKRRRGVLDLADLLPEAAGYLEDPGFAAATSWWFRHVLVDEAQDLNAAQWRLILAITGRDDDLCLIGDPDQAIYGWNGAEAGFLTDFEAEFPHARRRRLDHNYRCPPALVGVARQVLGRDPGTPDGLTADADDALAADQPVRIIDCPDDRAEADDVARLIGAALADGVGARRMAVLARTNAGLEPIAAALRRAGIPCETGRPLLSDPTVRHALRRLEHGPLQLRGEACRRELGEILDELDLSGRESEHHVGRGATRSTPAEQLLELVTEWAEHHPSGRPDELLHWLNATTRGHGGVDSGAGGVQLLTFHRAKGLEWRRVFLVGLAEDQVPLPGAAEPDEERRLLYVALTRAEEEVTCSWPARRLVGSTSAGRGASDLLGPSPWLEALRAGARRASEPGDHRSDIGPRLRALREELLARRRLPDATRPFTAPASRTA